jgi:penicillin-binding protein 1A
MRHSRNERIRALANRSEGFDVGRWRARARSGWTRLRAALGTPRRRWTVVGLTVLALGSCGTGTAVAAWTRACPGSCPTADQIEEFAPRQSSVVLDAEGGLLGSFYRERRTLISIDSLPEHVMMAFVAIEDRRFFEHEGVDPARMVAAVRDNIIRGWGGPGGSTITMQLARNLFPQQLPRNEKSIRRKVAEIRLAMEMERRFEKRRILELYLNHIYLGSGAYGIEAAARTYYGKPAAELTYLEAAVIAGLPQAPSAYTPRQFPDRALRRRDRVLRAMAEEGLITREQEQDGLQQPLALAPPRGAIRAPYFVENIRRDLEQRFGELLYTGGLRIHTALDPVLQAEAEAALEEQLRRMEGGAYGRFPHPTYERFVAGLEPGEPITTTPYVQGAVVVMEPATGLVRAMVGGRDFRHSQFNRATQALRQPGSAIKPFVFAAALEKGRSPLYSVSDGPLAIPTGDGGTWTPRNYDRTFGGFVTMRHALRLSRNVPTIRVGQEVGIDGVRDLMRRTGIRTDIPPYPSVFIGAADVYPAELMAGYAAFANGGRRVEPRYVVRVEDDAGNVLWEPAPFPEPAMDPAVAWIMTDMMREVVERGTATGIRNRAIGNLPHTIPAAGKTGTTTNAADVWFVGYTPDLLAGVWLGMDRPQGIMRNATGGALAVPIWARVVRKAYEDREHPEPWARPAGVVTRTMRGGIPLSGNCLYGGVDDFFAQRHMPEPGCPAALPEVETDPTPWLPGRPVFPGQAREPVPEDFVELPARGRRGRN